MDFCRIRLTCSEINIYMYLVAGILGRKQVVEEIWNAKTISAYKTFCKWTSIQYPLNDTISSVSLLQITAERTESLVGVGPKNRTVSELNEFKPRLQSSKNRFQLSFGLNIEKLNSIISGTNNIWAPVKF